MYNEAVLIPFFLRHYWFVDRIIILLGDTRGRIPGVPDTSESLLLADKRVVTVPLDMPDGFDDGIKIEAMNAAARGLFSLVDWVIMADADEFIFPAGNPGCDAFKRYLNFAEAGATSITVNMWDVYRHNTDRDLDIDLPGPVVFQRRHGQPHITDGYTKPSIGRSRFMPRWSEGHHGVRPDVRSRKVRFEAAHWQNADASFSLSRRIFDRWHRLSKNELAHKWGTGNYNLTAEILQKRYAAHANDPQII